MHVEDRAAVQQAFEVEINDDRYLFGKWLRRVMKASGMRFTDLRKMMGVSSSTFNRWMKDTPGVGSVEVPNDDECKLIADLLDVPEGFVLRLAARARDAQDDVVLTDRPKHVRRPRPTG